MRADPGARADRGVPLQARPRQDLRVLAQGDVRIDPGRRRVHDRHPGPHPVLEQPVVVGPADLRQLDPVVHALDLGRIGGEDRADRMAVAAQDRHHVGEVLLALRVVGHDPLDRVGQQRSVKGVAAGIDLVDRALLRRRVGVLDDVGQRAAVVPDDPPVAGRVADPRGQHGDRVSRRVVLPGQRGERAGPEQRHVAAGHQHDAGHDAEGLDHHAHGVTGARLAVLHDDDRVRHVPGGLGPDLLPAVPGDDHRALRVELAGRREHVPEHAASAQRMQHLGNPRFHPGALACGEDYDSGRARFAHAASLLG